jgi:hypothetical protein
MNRTPEISRLNYRLRPNPNGTNPREPQVVNQKERKIKLEPNKVGRELLYLCLSVLIEQKNRSQDIFYISSNSADNTPVALNPAGEIQIPKRQKVFTKTTVCTDRQNTKLEE